MAAQPLKSARDQGTHLGEFLRRVMMNAAPLTRPEDIAWFLASYARDALATLEEKEGSNLEPLRTSLQAALGIKFEGEKGEHFFRSTLVQTLFYGVFSAWVIWAKRGSSGEFDWKSAGYIITVPMIRSLFEEIAKPSRLAPLDLMSILDRLGVQPVVTDQHGARHAAGCYLLRSHPRAVEVDVGERFVPANAKFAAARDALAVCPLLLRHHSPKPIKITAALCAWPRPDLPASG